MMREFSLFQKCAVLCIAVLALLAALAAPAFAQNAGAGTITGTLSDPSGAFVPGAAVTIRNTDTAIERRIDSNEAGVYSPPFPPPGHYEVSPAKAGFASWVALTS